MSLRERGLAGLNALRQSAWSRQAISVVGCRQYRVGSPGGACDRLIARLLTLDAPTSADRVRSVDLLTELFFELTAVTGVRRFIEAGVKDASASIRAAAEADIESAIAFEANPYTYRRFTTSVLAAGVDYRHAALTDQTGEVSFRVRLTNDGVPMADGQGSMLVRPDHTSGYEEVRVSAVRLDDAVDVNAQPPTALWIDVEGASAQVLRGASTLLDSVQVAIIEVESDLRWEGQEWIDRNVIDFFVGVGLVPVARDRQSRRQYNVVFARTNDARAKAAIERWRAARSAEAHQRLERTGV